MVNTEEIHAGFLLKWTQHIKSESVARHWYLVPVIPAIWEAEIRRIKAPGQPGQIVCEILSPK
jgi:hypothetical protein